MHGSGPRRSSMREHHANCLDPFDRMESPWLAMQGVTPQEDDGCVVMKGKIAGQAAVVVALEGAFQGGSMGEVSGREDDCRSRSGVCRQ